MDVVAGIYPHLSSLKEFQPDVPVVVTRGSAEVHDSDEEFDDEAAFDPLADTMAEVVADSERQHPHQPSHFKKVGITEYKLEPHTVPGYGR